jgi:ribosome biogenesis GTPase / thiamine phosphate phosphatase
LTLPLTETSLQQIGWDDGWAAAFEPHRAAGLVPARVAVQHRGAYDLLAADGEIRAAGSQQLVRDHELPVVGDWVGYDQDGGLIEAVLPRRTSISRKEVWRAIREQVLAANMDIAFLVQALPLDFNLRRLERYLAMAWESGADPVVLLTKTDLVDDVEPFLADVETVTLGACPALALSSKTGERLDEIRPFFAGNKTAVLLGSSGAGKSTLVNALIGEELLKTAEVREDDQRGRHTTTRRELIVLPGGGVVLDTPGIRELHLWEADLEQVFSEIDELATHCRFDDCAHDQEPGCAVREALADGRLTPERWEAYLKLQKEQAALEVRRNVLARREQVRGYKVRERAMRKKDV